MRTLLRKLRCDKGSSGQDANRLSTAYGECDDSLENITPVTPQNSEQGAPVTPTSLNEDKKHIAVTEDDSKIDEKNSKEDEDATIVLSPQTSPPQTVGNEVSSEVHLEKEKVNSSEDPTKQEKCLAEGSGLHVAKQGCKAVFQIIGPLTDLFYLQLQILDSDGTELTTEIQCTEEFVHDISYCPVSTNDHTINVLWRGEHVKGSPFTVKISANQ